MEARLQNLQQRVKKYQCRHLWQLSPLVWNMPVNSKGGPEYVEDLCPLCMPCDMDRDNYTIPPFCNHPAVTAKPTA
jgi:hypothetical protein